MVEVLGQNLKLIQQIELQRFRQRRNLRGTEFVKDDLEHSSSQIVIPERSEESPTIFCRSQRHQINTRRTRWPIRVVISQVIVPAFSASSRHEISPSPCRPIKTTSSPTSTGGRCETSITIRSIVTRPNKSQRFPRTSICAPRFERCRG